jgi:hypothetical protein
VFCLDISDWNWLVEARVFEIDFTVITDTTPWGDEYHY